MNTSQISSPRQTGWIILTWIATLATIVINALANLLPLNGITTKEISDSIPSFFVPAGYVFSIWGLIYLGLLLWTIFQSLKSYATHPLVVKLRPLYLIAAIANSLWIFGWHYEMLPLTVPLMVILLISLIRIYTLIQKDPTRNSGAGRWMLAIPFSLYLGWICVATIANIAGLFVSLGWDGAPLAGQTWAALMMNIAVIIVGVLSWRNRDIIPILVLIWALIGIVLNFSTESTIVWTGWMLVGVLAIVGIIRVLYRPKSSNPS